MSLTIGRHAAVYNPDPRTRDAFGAQRWIRLPRLLDEPLLGRLDTDISRSVFTETSHASVTTRSHDLRIVGSIASELLVLLCNDPVVLHAVEDMTGLAGLTRFNGSMYRMLPDAQHQQEWHDDLVHDRVVALSINIGATDFAGGVLEIRDREAQARVAEVANTGRGDAVLFALDRSLEHRVTAVTAGVKTAFAGWFRRGTPLRDELCRAAILR
jgi:hypothetical protein